FGLNGTGLSVEFVEEVKVEAGGYMPEYGRATGGIVNAITKSGSNEFHGGVWGFYTPGQFQGQIKIPRREGQTIVAERNLSWLGDAGFDIGGRLIKDKLWFYGGVSVSRTRYDITTSWNRRVVDPITGLPQYADPKTGEITDDPDRGFSVTERVAGTTHSRKAQGTTVQALGKLTYTPATNHTLELLGIYAPSVSGGNGTWGLDARTGQPEVVSAAGDYTALANRYKDSSGDVQLKWNATSADHNWNVDTTVGWHHQLNSGLPVDGTRIGDNHGLAITPGVVWRRNNPDFHSITDFPRAAGASGAPAGACDPVPIANPEMGGPTFTNVCPVQNYSTGGPGQIYERSLDRGQVRSMATRLAQGAGHHLIKFGMDFEYMRYVSDRAYTGGTLYRETTNGTGFSDFRQYGFLSGPDQANILNHLKWTTYSTTIGGFIQDSWSIMDKVTLNAGLRYDAQHMFGGDGQMALAMPNQISPRVGLIWDPTQAGKAKLFINYARFYQSVPLNLADRAGSGEPQIASVHEAAFCDPTRVSSHRDACQDDAGRRTVGGPTSPDQKWLLTGAGKTPVDPKLKPQSSDEIVAGAEYEIFANGRLGANYTHRWLSNVIEDMSRDEAQTYFIGNPGYGIAKDFPKASRTYDALIVYLDKRFSRNFLISGSYTASWLRGNLAGLFRPETGQLDPNI
ncbi:MAG: TonB-dependent receptor, partial [Pseudomonadota bacterium]|nr:TonB-dependent receptor [Pseudomonadota bacterium]